MRNKRFYFLLPSFLFILLLLSFVFLSQNKGDEYIVLFCGAGMKIPVQEIAENFEELTGTQINMHFSGSSILRQYIETYGDVDIYMPGDKENIDMLDKKRLVKE